MLGTLNDSTILRLRVKGSDLDPLALRGRLENLFTEVSLQPRLPPSATLFIRKLNDPLPRAIRLDGPHAHAPLAWRHAFQTRFEQLVSSAARPAFGFVSDSAESVVFYDYAELLSSLTADWCSGSAMTRWWWQALIKRGDLSQLIKQYWREKIEYVPAALEHLVRRGVVVEFVSALSDEEAREMVQRVIRAFGLTRITRIKATDFFRLDVALEVGVATEVVDVAQVRSEMPWRHVVPESVTPRLRPAQQFFVGIALMVQRAPARARTLSFAREVEQWVQAQSIVEEPRLPELVIDGVPDVLSFERPKSMTPIRENPIYVDPVALNPDSPPEGSVSSVVKEPEQIKVGNAIFRYEEPVTPEVPIESPTTVIQSDPIIETPETPMTVSASEPLDAVTIETKFGGIFYLVNLAIFMEIYSDFTSPVEQFHDDLSIWEFVAIVAKEVAADEVDDDPIWELLVNLAGRDDEDAETKPEWLIDLLPKLRTRLVLALGIDENTNLAHILLDHHAKVTVTPTHLDVFFSLSDHPIEIRLSGLDRDPGWVPAAGRFIAFHYD